MPTILLYQLLFDTGGHTGHSEVIRDKHLKTVKHFCEGLSEGKFIFQKLLIFEIDQKLNFCTSMEYFFILEVLLRELSELMYDENKITTVGTYLGIRENISLAHISNSPRDIQ